MFNLLKTKSMDGSNLSYADFAAMANNGANGQWNNPFIYLLWMMFFGGGGFGFRGNGPGVGPQVQNLQDLIQDNHNSDLTMQAINGNTAAITQLANLLNTSTDNITAAINAMSQNMQNNCCQVKSAILEQGYQNQLANCQQTNTILQQAQALQNSITNGFTQIGFQLERNACDVKQTSTENTQRIIDTLNSHWTSEQQGIINSLNAKVASMEQTQAIISALKPATT
jgi:hypothetical protein